MLQTLIIDKNNEHSRSLENKLKTFCLFLKLNGILENKEDYTELLKKQNVQLLFINPEVVAPCIFDEIDLTKADKALICVSQSSDFITKKNYWNSVAYLLNPVEESGLIHAVELARQKVRKSQEDQWKNSILKNELADQDEMKLIGIPTIEGFEIIALESIIRCEGLQKCTRIVTTDTSSIVSSYNIGMYKKLLARSSNFFSSHRSHLVNLRFVSKFKKAGEIIMKDSSAVPIAKNRREAFLSRITRI